MSTRSNRSIGEKMGDWFRHVLSCCDRDEREEERPALQISGPTNFRREDISIPGLEPEHQRWIREKAISDAGRMWEHLQPLRSSPSAQFANPNTATLPSYEDFTTPRSAPDLPSGGGGGRRPSTSHQQQQQQPSPLDRFKAHSRKISNSLGKPLGYQAVGGGGGGGGKESGGNPYEMRALMDPSRTQVGGSPQQGGIGKMSGESFSVAGSEEDRDSAKGGIVRI